MSTLYFIRHAQASFGEENYDRLSETGIKQSVILGQYLSSIKMQFDEIYCGTMERQKDTAGKYLSTAEMTGLSVPDIRYDSRLNEYDAKKIMTILIPVLLSEKPQMNEHMDKLLTDRKSFQIVFSEVMDMWCSGKYAMDGTATWEEFLSGIQGFLEDRMKEHSGNRKIAVFTSGGPISAVIMKILSLDIGTSMLVRDRIVNSSITRFKYSAYKMMITSFNEYSHLELAGGKEIITYR